ncbi:hypothetical protein Mgra_00001434 [Meloidogyne graminicola]|uniref:Uncharacterized protein n=1 Tax=Meloidogyne graminicola TaxID=189291 RepID=A0A8T0A2C2_9BILA|nr:hypothetical protein Mgra_00001434 [Meloidogyne graminicola]
MKKKLIIFILYLFNVYNINKQFYIVVIFVVKVNQILLDLLKLIIIKKKKKKILNIKINWRWKGDEQKNKKELFKKLVKKKGMKKGKRMEDQNLKKQKAGDEKK